MSHYQFEIKGGTLSLNKDFLPSTYPLLRDLPFNFKNLLLELSSNNSILDFVEEYYQRLNQQPGSERHVIGTLYMNQFITEKFRRGNLGWECTIKKEKKFFKPDITLLNGSVYFIEIQSSGFISEKKAYRIKSLRCSVKRGELSVAIPDDKKCIKRLRRHIKKHKLQPYIEEVYLFPSTLKEFVEENVSNVIKRFTTDEFLNGALAVYKNSVL